MAIIIICTYCHYEVKLIDLLAKNILKAKSNMCSIINAKRIINFYSRKENKCSSIISE